MNIPDESGFFPFRRFTADELRHFFVWCAAHKVSDVDPIGGSPVSVSHLGRQVRRFSATLPTMLISSLIDELFGRGIIPRVLADNPANRTVQINGDTSDRYGLKRGERVRSRSRLIQGTSNVEEKTISITMRVIPTEIPGILSMNIEPGLLETMIYESGLGFVCGETRSGKSTPYPVLYHCIMDNLPDARIVTYEDPVEYILRNENDPLPSHQAEIGRNVVSFVAGLCSAVRYNPKVIGVGEIKGNETTDATVQAGNTGRYCLNTTHTKSPGEALAHLFGLFPPVIRDSMAWAVLSLLQFVLAQVLVRINDGGRKAVREYIVTNDEPRNNLPGVPYAEWEHYINAIIRQKKRRIQDQILETYIQNETDRREAILFIPSEELWS